MGKERINASLIAKSLKEKTLTPEEPYIAIDGIRVSYPFSWVGTLPWDVAISPQEWENYKSMKQLFEEEGIPPEWISFLKETVPLLVESGSDCPINLIESVGLVVEENPKVEGREIPLLGRFPTGEVDLTDSGRVKMVVNRVLGDPELKEELKKIIRWSIPDISNFPIDMGRFAELLNSLGINSGIMVDFGCGTGTRILGWRKNINNLFMVAIDRRYHDLFYAPAWRSKTEKLAFLRGDLRAVPIKSDSADVILMGNLVRYVIPEALEQILHEAKRVLKPDKGILAIGPQNEKDSWWIFYKKEDGELVEYTFSRLMSETKG